MNADVREAKRLLCGLLATAIDEGGPSPLEDALLRWQDICDWRIRRPIERALAQMVMADLWRQLS